MLVQTAIQGCTQSRLPTTGRRMAASMHVAPGQAASRRTNERCAIHARPCAEVHACPMEVETDNQEGNCMHLHATRRSEACACGCRWGCVCVGVWLAVLAIVQATRLQTGRDL